MRQEAARKTVPIEELEEKALVSLAKVRAFVSSQKIYVLSAHFVVFSVGLNWCVEIYQFALC